jgi:uncharacterized protein with HEPN domain
MAAHRRYAGQPLHGYDIVDLDEVWRTAETDVPELLRLIEPLLPEG